MKNSKSTESPKNIRLPTKSNSKKSSVPKTAFQPTKNTVSPNSSSSSSGVRTSKATKINTISMLRPPFAKFKGPKQLQHFMTEAMESEANDHNSDYTDIDYDSMSDLTIPN